MDSPNAITLTQNEAGRFIDMAKKLTQKQNESLDEILVSKMESRAREALGGKLTVEIDINEDTMLKILKLAKQTRSSYLYGAARTYGEKAEKTAARIYTEPLILQTIDTFIQLLNLEYLRLGQKD